MFKIIIKDDHDNEVLEYKVEEFINDFSKKISETKIPMFGEEKKRLVYFEIAENLIRSFKKKTVRLIKP